MRAVLTTLAFIVRGRSGLGRAPGNALKERRVAIWDGGSAAIGAEWWHSAASCCLDW